MAANELITGLTGLFCAAVSSIVTFLVTRKKYNAEVDSQQIKNLEDSFNVYKEMMEESLASQKRLMEATLTFNNKIIEDLNRKVEELQKENELLRGQVSELQMQVIKFLGKNKK